jgi:hypothetical protein
MAGDDIDDFRIRIGRSRSRGARGNWLSQPFLKQVEAAVREAGGNPKRIGGPAGRGNGRFNARGRGAKLSFPKDSGGWRPGSAGRVRSWRLVVKARVVKLNLQRGARGPKMRGTAPPLSSARRPSTSGGAQSLRLSSVRFLILPPSR